MSWEPIDDLPEETHHDEPFEECEHEFNFGICVDCDAINEDYDPTPHGAELVTDWADSCSYKGMVAA